MRYRSDMSFMDSPGDAERRQALRKHRTIATGLLIFAAIVLVSTHFLEGAWVPFLRATAEAGMVGGLADWFAVTALFKHPLGLKIPHTALIKNKKDQVGESLSGFISQNFLNAESITAKISELNPSKLIAEGLRGHATAIDKEFRVLAVNFIESVDENTATELIETLVLDNVMDTEWAPPAGRFLSRLEKKGVTLDALDKIFAWAAQKASTSDEVREAIGRMVNDRMSGLPSFLSDIAADKVYRELCKWLWSVANDPDHEIKYTIDDKLRVYAQRLQDNPEMLEHLKDQVRATEQYQQAPAKIWEYSQREIVETLKRDESIVSQRIVATILNLADRCENDQEFAARLNSRIERGTAFVVERYGSQVTNIISETVERWDADQASEKIELMVGKDLQFIRINGTVVGALAGFFIYTCMHLLNHVL
ncbi:MAG: DUF445 family protein [Corynebacterium sp.]|nr:DUF445 family protein [Corynebacterium sp.]